MKKNVEERTMREELVNYSIVYLFVFSIIQFFHSISSLNVFCIYFAMGYFTVLSPAVTFSCF